MIFGKDRYKTLIKTINLIPGVSHCKPLKNNDFALTLT